MAVDVGGSRSEAPSQIPNFSTSLLPNLQPPSFNYELSAISCALFYLTPLMKLHPQRFQVSATPWYKGVQQPGSIKLLLRFAWERFATSVKIERIP